MSTINGSQQIQPSPPPPPPPPPVEKKDPQNQEQCVDRKEAKTEDWRPLTRQLSIDVNSITEPDAKDLETTPTNNLAPAEQSRNNHSVKSLSELRGSVNEVEIKSGNAGTAPLCSTTTSSNAPTGKKADTQPPQAAPTVRESIESSARALNDVSKAYNESAEGKAPIQKGMDELRKPINEGYGDDQFKNIGKTQAAIGELRQQVDNGTITDADAKIKLSELTTSFKNEYDRVAAAQGENAKVGKLVNNVARTGTVIAAGVGGTVAGGGVNLATGFAAATGAGAGYDLISEAAFKGSKDNKFVDTQVQDDITSVGNIVGRKIKGEEVTGSDVARGVVSSVGDGVNGMFAGKGVANGIANTAAQAAAKPTLVAAGVNAVKTNMPLAVAQTAANTFTQSANTALNQNLTPAQKNTQFEQIAKGAVVQLATSPINSFMGGAAQFSNKTATTVAQVGIDAATNVGQKSIQNAANGQGFGVNKLDVAEGIGSAAANRVATNAGQTIGSKFPASAKNVVSAPELTGNSVKVATKPGEGKTGAAVSAAENKSAAESAQTDTPDTKSVTYSDGARVEYKQIDNKAVQRQIVDYDQLPNYNEKRMGDLIARHAGSPEQQGATGTPYKVIPVSGKDKTIPSLGEMQILSESMAASGAKGAEIGLATRIGDPKDVVMVVGTENSLPLPNGYRLASHTHPSNSAPSPEDFNVSMRPLVIPQDGQNIMMGTKVTGFETTPVYGKENAIPKGQGDSAPTITAGELARSRGANQPIAGTTSSSEERASANIKADPNVESYMKSTGARGRQVIYDAVDNVRNRSDVKAATQKYEQALPEEKAATNSAEPIKVSSGAEALGLSTVLSTRRDRGVLDVEFAGGGSASITRGPRYASDTRPSFTPGEQLVGSAPNAENKRVSFGTYADLPAKVEKHAAESGKSVQDIYDQANKTMRGAASPHWSQSEKDFAAQIALLKIVEMSRNPQAVVLTVEHTLSAGRASGEGGITLQQSQTNDPMTPEKAVKVSDAVQKATTKLADKNNIQIAAGNNASTLKPEIKFKTESDLGAQKSAMLENQYDMLSRVLEESMGTQAPQFSVDASKNPLATTYDGRVSNPLFTGEFGYPENVNKAMTNAVIKRVEDNLGLGPRENLPGR